MNISHKHLLTSDETGIGLIFRSGDELERISVCQTDYGLAFVNASCVPEETLYDSGFFVGALNNLILVSVRPVVLTLDESVASLQFTANKEPVGPTSLTRITDKKAVVEDDFLHPGEFHLLKTAALHARGHCRLPRISRTATGDGIVLRTFSKAA